MKNYYQVLGVSEDATQEDIKRAYKKLAVQFHPDKNLGKPEAEASFKEVNEANQTLGSVDKRQQYDMERMFQQGRHGSAHSFWAPFPVVVDTTVGIQITLKQQYMEDKIEFNYTRENKLGARTLESCKLESVQYLRNRQVYRFQKMGNYFHEAKDYGNLNVVVDIERDPRFMVRGHNMHTVLEVHYQDAIDGAKVPFVHIDGLEMRISLPARAWKSQQVRIPGKGLPAGPGKRGDLVLTLDITIDYGRVSKEVLVAEPDVAYNSESDTTDDVTENGKSE